MAETLSGYGTSFARGFLECIHGSRNVGLWAHFMNEDKVCS